jgi:cytochrome c
MYQQSLRSLAMGRVLAACAGIALLQCWPVTPAKAQTTPNTPAEGKRLAEQYCVSCHIIAPTGQGGWTDAPRFDAIANRPNISAAWISDFLQKPHMNMLNDQRPVPEAQAIATYILSLRKH